jgi:tetratricopeptide (TPR) repeat protein
LKDGEKAKSHAEVCNCGAKNLHEYIEYHFLDLDEPSRRKYERVMGTWKPTEEEIKFVQQVKEKDSPDQEEFLKEETAVCVYTELYSTFRQLGMLHVAIRVALETILRFPDDPASYQNLADGLWAIGLKQETKQLLQQAVERFPGDGELIAFLKDVEDDLDNDQPDGGEFLTLLLIVAAVSAHKKLRKK